MVNAAIEAIVELGYYRASSNEIARRAGVSWGAIQHHFQTRERLMFAAFEEATREMTVKLREAKVTGSTLVERLMSVQEVIFEFYGRREYTAMLQVMWNLSSDPDTADDIKQELREVLSFVGAEYHRLMLQVSPTVTTEFALIGHTICWGLAVAQSHSRTMAVRDDEASAGYFAAAQRTLAQALAGLIEPADGAG